MLRSKNKEVSAADHYVDVDNLDIHVLRVRIFRWRTVKFRCFCRTAGHIRLYAVLPPRHYSSAHASLYVSEMSVS